jgi:hypothetical protein
VDTDAVPTDRYFSELYQKMDIIHKTVEKNLEENERHMKARHDKTAKTVVFQPGDQVWLWSPNLSPVPSRKLKLKWVGPYVVSERIGPVNYRLITRDNVRIHKVVHVNRLRPVYNPHKRPGNRIEPREPVQDVLEVVEQNIPTDSFEPDVKVGLPRAVKPPQRQARQRQIQDKQELKQGDPLGSDICHVDKILEHKTVKGKRQFKIRWQGGEKTWEPEDNILGERLIQDYFQDRRESMQRRRRRGMCR